MQAARLFRTDSCASLQATSAADYDPGLVRAYSSSPTRRARHRRHGALTPQVQQPNTHSHPKRRICGHRRMVQD